MRTFTPWTIPWPAAGCLTKNVVKSYLIEMFQQWRLYVVEECIYLLRRYHEILFGSGSNEAPLLSLSFVLSPNTTATNNPMRPRAVRTSRLWSYEQYAIQQWMGRYNGWHNGWYNGFAKTYDCCAPIMHSTRQACIYVDILLSVQSMQRISGVTSLLNPFFACIRVFGHILVEIRVG